MNEEQRKKLVILKSTNKEYIKKLQWKNNTLLQECLSSLRTYQIISDETMIRYVVEIANSIKMIRILHSDKPEIEKDHDYYIVWDDEAVPIIKCKGNDILEKWDDIISVAFDMCVVDCGTELGFFIRG